MSKVIVIGGGASGLVAAIYAKKVGNDVVLLEKNNKCGKKILITGNGKCNYWNNTQDLSKYHSNSTDKLDLLINKETENEILNFLTSIGIVPYIKNGYWYPLSNQASTFLNALIKEANVLGVEIINEVEVLKITKENEFLIYTNKDHYTANQVIIATGGSSAPKTGSDGSGFLLAKKLGHHIIKPLPALVGLKVESKYLKELAGVRANVKVSLYEDNNFIKEEDGELQLTNYGISGICVMQLSGLISRGLDELKKEEIVINFAKEIASNVDEFKLWLKKQSEIVSKRTIKELLDSILNYNIVNTFLKLTKIKDNKYYEDLALDEIDKISNIIINHRLLINGTNDFDNSQVTSGGVDLQEIDLYTLESKIIKGLYFCGEVLDVDGDCGGYNLGFAFRTGAKAGISTKESDKND